jgi:hypothetical protein
MGRRGFRSDISIQRRVAEDIVENNVYQDDIVTETVNTLSPEEIMILVTKQVGDCAISVANAYLEAEIRTDSLGRGTLQLPDRIQATQPELRGWDKRGKD